MKFITGRVATAEIAAKCPQCEAKFCYPIDWEQVTKPYWKVTLRCPDCEHRRDAHMIEEEIERFDNDLDRGTDALVRDLRRLTYSNMATEINAFVAAIDAGHVLPEDFGRVA